MPLTDVRLDCLPAKVPADVAGFLREADRRIEAFQHQVRVPGFVPSDFTQVYGFLRSLAAADLTRGNLFCEWGSGFGVVACLAAMLDFDAVGIEIEGDLVEEAQQLADDFGLPVEFIRGSFIPVGSEAYVDADFSWLTTEEDRTSEELGLGPDDFDVIFAYPWPDEEGVTEALFERYARRGAVLATYHGSDDVRLRRKR
jgi:predicted O-methyltransferase YrrM